MLNIKVMHLDVLHRAPMKITTKYVTELIKLLPLLGRKKNNNCSTSFLMHVSHCEIILLSLCNLVRGSWRDPPPKMSEELKFDFQKTPNLLKDRWSNMAAMQSNFCEWKCNLELGLSHCSVQLASLSRCSSAWPQPAPSSPASVPAVRLGGLYCVQWCLDDTANHIVKYAGGTTNSGAFYLTW